MRLRYLSESTDENAVRWNNRSGQRQWLGSDVKELRDSPMVHMGHGDIQFYDAFERPSLCDYLYALTLVNV